MSTLLSLVLSMAAALVVLVAPAPLQDAPAAPAAPAVPALSSLELPFDKLKDGRQEFEFRTGKAGAMETVGSFVMTTAIADGKVTLTDRGELALPGKAFWFEITATGELGPELRPAHLAVHGTTDDGDGKTFEMSAEFTATSASMTSDGKKRDVTVPAGTVTDGALFRLVTLLPRRAGFTASFEHVLDATEMHVNPGGTITCTSASEQLDVGGKNVGASRFDVTSGGDVFLSLWVDDGGKLLQACLDGQKWFVAKG